MMKNRVGATLGLHCPLCSAECAKYSSVIPDGDSVRFSVECELHGSINIQVPRAVWDEECTVVDEVLQHTATCDKAGVDHGCFTEVYPPHARRWMTGKVHEARSRADADGIYRTACGHVIEPRGMSATRDPVSCKACLAALGLPAPNHPAAAPWRGMLPAGWAESRVPVPNVVKAGLNRLHRAGFHSLLEIERHEPRADLVEAVGEITLARVLEFILDMRHAAGGR